MKKLVEADVSQPKLSVQVIRKIDWKTVVVLISVLSMGFSMITMGVVWVRLNDYEYNRAAMQWYDIQVQLEIQDLAFTTREIVLPLLGQPDLTTKIDGTVDNWVYTFQNEALGLNASWRWVKLNIKVPSKTFERFRVECHWTIEDNTGIITAANFVSNPNSHLYKSAIFDISKYMWKEDVPQKIEVVIDLTN